MSQRFDELAKASAVLVIGVYLVGFAVVAFHDGSFGFVAYNVFRAKILSAGLLFLVFLSFPVLESAKIFGLFGFTRSVSVPDGGPKRINVLILTQILILAITAVGFSWFLRFLLVEPDVYPRFINIAIGLLIAVALIVLLMIKQLAKMATAFACIVLALIIGGVAVVILADPWVSLWFVAWFLVSAYGTTSIGRLVENPGQFRAFGWGFFLLTVALLVSIFAGGIYPHVNSIYGGGATDANCISVFKRCIDRQNVGIWKFPRRRSRRRLLCCKVPA